MTTTQRNQVTTVRLAAAPFSLESVHGSVTPARTPEDFKNVSRHAKESKAAETMRKVRETCVQFPPGPASQTFFGGPKQAGKAVTGDESGIEDMS